MSDPTPPLWVQFSLQGPALLACAATAVLALLLLRRQTRRAVFVLLAAALLAAAEVVLPVVDYTAFNPADEGFEMQRYLALSNGVGFAASIARGLALTLLAGAAFLPGKDRRPESPPGEAGPLSGPHAEVTGR